MTEHIIVEYEESTRTIMMRRLLVATCVSLLPVAAHAEGLSQMGHGYAGPPAENHPKVDEKAYKDALDRIPTPDRKFDPWGIARPSEPPRTSRKSN